MSQSPYPGRDQWPSPSPSAGRITEGHAADSAPHSADPSIDADDTSITPLPAAPTAPAGPAGHQQRGAPYPDPPHYQDPYDRAAQNPRQPSPPSVFAVPYGDPAPLQPLPVRGRRGPGWIGTVAIGGGAAMLASLLTAVIVENRADTTATTSQPPSIVGNSNSSAQTFAPPVDGTPTNPNWPAVAAAVQPSVVAVQLSLSNGQGDEGSGILYDTKGQVVTNNHVVADARSGQLSVILNDGRIYSAFVVGTDPSTDLAVLQIKNPPADLKPATFGDSTAVKVGDPAMALGNPLGLSDTVTTGIISALNRTVTTKQSQKGSSGDPFGFGQALAEQVVTNAIQTDAAINLGNSGGALVDAQGRVIGVPSSIASLGSSSGQAVNIGLGFAIPSNEAKDVAEQLIQTGSVKHARLGATLKDGTTTIGGARRQAAVVESVDAGGAAAAGGVKSGDVIVALNGTTIDGSDSLIAQIRSRRPGTQITLTVVRNGNRRYLQVILGTRAFGNG